MNKAIVTIVVGDHTNAIFAETKPYIEVYADKVGADLIVLEKFEGGDLPSPHWMKLAIHEFLHKDYFRLIYMDADILIRPDTPDLFEMVKEDELGIFNEGTFVPRAIALHEVKVRMKNPLEGWDGLTYYNTGVMVISRPHRWIFKPPERIPKFQYAFAEQTYLNYKIISGKAKVKELPYQFNRMGIMNKWLGVSRLDSYFVHYAGEYDTKKVVNTIKKDKERWLSDAPEYHYEPCIYVTVGGGLGDQLCAEPALRYLREKIHPKAEMFVLTNYPRLFRHLNLEVGDKMPEIFRDAIFEIKTHPSTTTQLRKYVSHLFTHGVDYNSIAILKRTLPSELKTPRIEIAVEDREEVKDYDVDVIVHPGRGWPINTFPIEWWREVILGLQRCFKVGIIGKNVNDEHGVLNFPMDDVLDLRDKLSLGGLLAMIEKTWCLVTNDSAPVHLAGAFDNNIILIPTSKHPDHLLPYRNGKQDYKAKAVVGKLLEDDFPMYANTFEWSTTTHKIDVRDYLPSEEEVIKEVMKLGVPAPKIDYSRKRRDTNLSQSCGLNASCE